jgi:hypothetical protein
MAPVINKYWADDAFPFDLPSIRALKIARIDCSCATFFGLHSGLAMDSIYLDGSEEQKQPKASSCAPHSGEISASGLSRS